MFVCDGIKDCISGADELDCYYPDSCQALWDAGYQTSGIYDIGKNCPSPDLFRHRHALLFVRLERLFETEVCSNGRHFSVVTPISTGVLLHIWRGTTCLPL